LKERLFSKEPLRLTGSKSVGRTDLPGGDHTLLLQSIHQQLFPLGDKVVVDPGHGPTTTIGKEKGTHFLC
jgi:hydroxyacylglutathione hydrolase